MELTQNPSQAPDQEVAAALEVAAERALWWLLGHARRWTDNPNDVRALRAHFIRDGSEPSGLVGVR